MPCMPSDRLLTTQEAADLRGVDPSTITRWVKRGRLAPAEVVGAGVKRPTLYLFRSSDVRAA